MINLHKKDSFNHIIENLVVNTNIKNRLIIEIFTNLICRISFLKYLKLKRLKLSKENLININ